MKFAKPLFCTNFNQGKYFFNPTEVIIGINADIHALISDEFLWIFWKYKLTIFIKLWTPFACQFMLSYIFTLVKNKMLLSIA